MKISLPLAKGFAKISVVLLAIGIFHSSFRLIVGGSLFKFVSPASFGFNLGSDEYDFSMLKP